jgi:hypothetical protein
MATRRGYSVNTITTEVRKEIIEILVEKVISGSFNYLAETHKLYPQYTYKQIRTLSKTAFLHLEKYKLQDDELFMIVNNKLIALLTYYESIDDKFYIDKTLAMLIKLNGLNKPVKVEVDNSTYEVSYDQED